MIAFTEIKLHRQWVDFNEEEHTYRGTMTPSEETLEDLIAANTAEKLKEFTSKWLPFMSFRCSWEHPDFEEEMKAVSDTRNLMLLVLELKRMADEGDCSRGAFEALGATFTGRESGDSEQAEVHFLATSETFSKYIRANTNCEKVEASFIERFMGDEKHKEWYTENGYIDEAGNVYCPFASLSYATGSLILKEHLYLNSQEEAAQGIDPNLRYPVMSFFGGNLGMKSTYTPRRAYFFIDSIIRDCIQGLRIRTKDGLLAPQADTNFTSLWLCLSDSFRESRVTACKTCGLPIIVSKERGAKRLYCNNTCKRKYKRALKFATLVNDEGMDEQSASKASGMAAATATRILKRNGL